MKKHIVSILCLGLLAGCIRFSNFDQGHFVPTAQEPVSIPLEVIKDLMVIEAEVNGVKGRFLFDNGFSLSAINADFAQKAKVAFEGSAQVKDANNKSKGTPKTVIDTVRIKGQTFVGTGFYQIDTKKFFPCDPIDGIIGASIINKANWEVDYLNKTMRIASIPFEGEGQTIDVSFSSNNSNFMDFEVNGIRLSGKIDLGNQCQVNVSLDEVKEKFQGSIVKKSKGALSVSAHGLGNLDSSYLLAEPLPLKHKNKQLEMSAQVALKGRLKYDAYVGMNYFKQYKFAINSTKKEYLLMEANPKETQDAEKSYGLSMYLMDGTWRIVLLNPNDSLVKEIPLMVEVERLDEEPMSRFPSICAYKEYMNDKIEKELPISIQLKGDTSTLILPYREVILGKLE